MLLLCKDLGLTQAACSPCARLREQSLEEAGALLYGVFSVSLGRGTGRPSVKRREQAVLAAHQEPGAHCALGSHGSTRTPAQHESSLLRVTDCTLRTLCLSLYDSHVVNWLLPAGAGAAWELTHKSALAAAAHVCFVCLADRLCAQAAQAKALAKVVRRSQALFNAINTINTPHDSLPAVCKVCCLLKLIPR